MHMRPFRPVRIGTLLLSTAWLTAWLTAWAQVWAGDCERFLMSGNTSRTAAVAELLIWELSVPRGTGLKKYIQALERSKNLLKAEAPLSLHVPSLLARALPGPAH